MADEISLLKPREAMEILRLGRSFFYQAVRQGDLPAVRFGRVLRFRRCDLETFIIAHEQGALDPEAYKTAPS